MIAVEREMSFRGFGNLQTKEKGCPNHFQKTVCRINSSKQHLWIGMCPASVTSLTFWMGYSWLVGDRWGQKTWKKNPSRLSQPEKGEIQNEIHCMPWKDSILDFHIWTVAKLLQRKVRMILVNYVRFSMPQGLQTVWRMTQNPQKAEKTHLVKSIENHASGTLREPASLWSFSNVSLFHIRS